MSLAHEIGLAKRDVLTRAREYEEAFRRYMKDAGQFEALQMAEHHLFEAAYFLARRLALVQVDRASPFVLRKEES